MSHLIHHEQVEGSPTRVDPPVASVSQRVAIEPAIRLKTIQVSYTAPPTSQAAVATPPILLHLSIRCFADHIFLSITEDTPCAPGTLLHYTAPPTGPVAFLYDGETPSVHCTTLLGMRDHPLTNLLASAVAVTIQRCGETRPLLMCLNVREAAKQLRSSDERRRFLDAVKANVLELARQPSA